MSKKDEISKHLDSKTDPSITSESQPPISGTNGRGTKPNSQEKSEEKGKALSNKSSQAHLGQSESSPTGEDAPIKDSASDHHKAEPELSDTQSATDPQHESAPGEKNTVVNEETQKADESDPPIDQDQDDLTTATVSGLPEKSEKTQDEPKEPETEENLPDQQAKDSDEPQSETEIALEDKDDKPSSESAEPETEENLPDQQAKDSDEPQSETEIALEGKDDKPSPESAGPEIEVNLQEEKQSKKGDEPHSKTEVTLEDKDDKPSSESAEPETEENLPDQQAKDSDEPQSETEVTLEGKDDEPSPESAGPETDENLSGERAKDGDDPHSKTEVAIEAGAKESLPDPKDTADTSTEKEKAEATAKTVRKTESAPVWEQIEFGDLDKMGLVEMMEAMARHQNPIEAAKAAKKLRPIFNKLQKAEKKAALEQFVKDGNDADGFAYRLDDLDNRFDAAFKLLKDRKVQRIKDLEKEKESNYQEKTQLLEELRTLVEEEETNFSINDLKKVQERWRKLGPVPGQYAKSLWANYHALLDLYYDRRSIYFELKELDRKKNLEAKLELCERAEKLDDYDDLRTAISELNELHEEFKHIGPVPKSEQEALWDRFKAASDRIYAKRKEFVKNLKKDLKENLRKKSALAEEVQPFAKFNSDRITDWNKKTKELQQLQKKWESIGGLPREHAKKVNRRFWGSFKTFFQHKGQFFKTLEGERTVNLEKKMELVKEAEELKDSTQWNETANRLKALQKDWRDIGPVPEKQRNEVYSRFKKACDQFFNNRRAQNREIEKSYVDNLKKKQEICYDIEAMTTSKDFDLDKFLELKDDFEQIGYVPGSEVRNIRRQFKDTASEYLESVPEEMKAEAREIKYQIEFQGLNEGRDASRRKGKKEQGLRREIGSLENDISTWKNNLEFFADSKTADKLREEFSDKIDDANRQLRELKRQLRALRQM